MAVNPYQFFDIYNLDTVHKYEGQLIGSLPPHVFAIGAGALLNLSKTGRDQCVIISGESGAGKTESTKVLLSHFPP